MSDPAFDAHWAAMAEEDEAVIGELVAGFRRERGLSRAELARRELAEERLAEIEEGRARASFATWAGAGAVGAGSRRPGVERDDPAAERPVEVGAAGSARS
jgi:hypothetical protein